ncbi:MAG: gluconate 2-dehydrogenase subunit 3 family protein [Bacteroidia bacterium]|nr:gluconate 2-dehydrogenase subunit 3 family protein [Bacteroidia bacterium]
MNRRDAIKKSMLMTGVVLSASTITAILSGCQPDGTASTWTPQALDQNQANLLSDLCESILPATDTPGAIDLGVPKFIDDMVANYMNEKHRKQFIEGLDKVNADAQSKHGKDYLSLEEAEKMEMLTAYDKESYNFNMKWKNKVRPKDLVSPFFGKLKGLTMTGYFTTEVGASQVLKYDYVPGGYSGCIPVEEVGGAWVNA